MKFSISGTIKLKEARSFTKSIEAKSEKHARELLYAAFASRNGLSRDRIKIGKVSKE